MNAYERLKKDLERSQQEIEDLQARVQDLEDERDQLKELLREPLVKFDLSLLE